MLQRSSNRSLIFHLILFSLVGAFLAGFVSVSLSMAFPNYADSIWMLRLSIVLQDALVLFFPAYSVFKFSTERSFFMLGLKKDERLVSKLLFALAVYVSALGATTMLARWNANVVFPDFLSGLETKFRSMEDSAMRVTEKLLSGVGLHDLLINLLLVAFLAALVEEVFFRGALQQLLSKWFNNGHVAVWISAFIFSAIHLQFFGFVPRFIMGAILGYLFFYTNNLWVPILYHFANNAIVVIINFYWGESSFVKSMDSAPLTIVSWIVMLLSLGATFVLFAKWGRKYKQG